MKKRYLSIPNDQKVVIVLPVLMGNIFGLNALEQTRNGHISVIDISGRKYALGQVKDSRGTGVIDLLFQQEKGNLDDIISKSILPLCTSGSCQQL